MLYTTITGDTFDIIARRTLGNELLASRIIEANPDYADVLIFSHNTKLQIPEEVIEEATTDELRMPPWKRGNAE